MPIRRRCQWAEEQDTDYVRYHDDEWGRPVHDDRLLFEMLTLEGAQAGLSGGPSCASARTIERPSQTSTRYGWRASMPASGPR